MPSLLYKNVVTLVSSFVGPEKGPGILERQLGFVAGATADSFDKSDLKKIELSIVAATRLYLRDPSKVDAFKSKVSAMAN
jgi:hypothetical protein